MDLDNRMVVAYRGAAGDERLWDTAWTNLVSPPVWTSPTVIGNGTFNSSHAPALWAVPGLSTMAWKGCGNDQRLFVAVLHGTVAAAAPVPPVHDGTFLTIDRPAILNDPNGDILLVWRAPDNTLQWSLSVSAGPWLAARAVGATSRTGPALTQSGGKTLALWGAVEDGRLWQAEFTGTGWTSPTPVSLACGAALTSDTPAAIDHQGQLLLAWKGVADQNIWSTSPGGTPTAITPQRGAVLTDHGPALAITNDPAIPGPVLRLVWKGVPGDQHLWWSSRPANGNWTTPQILNPAVNTAAGPAMATTNTATF